ncbi:hypothetical protein DFA_04790 [Cavenderia fasciculata]|uniref:Tetratricopeptide-like helical domain-containing protein n=1 Tax=Cavenderia fasciculata TaxID=261658 RepID=F4PNY1_CACFS|nr:uncharacterized protein DFA_04790 [Cavenderia fasciculata]EGG22660.1 hypothetical protein DFA_04790 [Cavenderia fasciculata]|eukprot:XP_004360511.1 hypothetical protein DFA_04790 [Cavenderia fasciculata]
MNKLLFSFSSPSTYCYTQSTIVKNVVTPMLVRFYSSSTAPKNSSSRTATTATNTTTAVIESSPDAKLLSEITKQSDVNIRKSTYNSLDTIINGKELLDRGNFPEGEKLIVQGFKSMKKNIHFSSSLFAFPTHAMGLASLKSGHYSNSEKLLRLSIDRCDNIMYQHHMLPKALNDLGLTLVRQRRSEEAMTQFETANKLALQSPILEQSNISASILTNQAELYKSRCMYNDAKLFHGMAHYQLVQSGRGNDNIDMFRCQMNRAQIFRLSNQIQEGKSFLSEAYATLKSVEGNDDKYQPLALRRSLPSPVKEKRLLDWAKFLVECGHFHFDEQNFKLAKKSWTDAREIFQQLKTPLTPDAMINSINMSILERLKPTEPNPQEYVTSLLEGIDPTNKELMAMVESLKIIHPSIIVARLLSFSDAPALALSSINTIPPLHFPLR